jgi:hypothetical protein
MSIDWGLASPPPNDQSYLGPLQAMAAGRQAALESRRLAARQAAFGQAARGDLEGAERTALAGGDTEAADYVRAASARSAAGQVIGMYGTPGASTGAPAAPQSPVQSLIAAGTPGAPPAPNLARGPAVDPLAPLPEQAPPSPMADHMHDTAVAIGHAATSGQPIDPTQAWSHLYSLDPAMGDKMMAAVGQMDTLRKTRLAETTDALANAAQSLLSVPPEQRAAAAQQMLPMLAAHGVTADQLTAANLSDQGLKGIIGQSLGVKGMLDQSNKETEFGFKDRETTVAEKAQVATATNQAGTLAETTRHNQVEEGKPMAAGFGTALVKPDGTVVYDPNAPQDTFSRMLKVESGGQQGGANGPTTSPKGAIGIAQVMPGTGPEAARLAGLPWDASRYKTDAAYNATIGRAYFQSLVQRYGGDEAKATAAYNGGMGRVDRAVAARGAGWLTAMPAETRAYVSKVTSGSGPNPAIEAQARAIAENRLPPLIGRAAVTGIGGAVMRRAMEINPNLDGTTFATDKTGRAKFTSGKQGDTIRSLDVAVTHLDQLQGLADALHNGNTPLFNRIGQQLAQSTGSAVPTNFDSVKEFVLDEVTKAVIGSGGGVGDREKASAIISRVQSPAQLAGAIYQVKGLMSGQLRGLSQQYKNATGRDDFSSLVSDHTARVLNLHSPQVASSGTPSDIRAIMAKYGAH